MSIENPRQEAGEPRWRCSACGADRWVGWRAGPENEGYPRKAQCVPCGHVQELPANAVKLEDIEALREAHQIAIEHRNEAIEMAEDMREQLEAAERERDALRAEIVGAWCALTDGERDEIDELAPGVHRLLERLTGDVNRAAILDREPGREEPASAPLPTEPICLGCGVDNCEHVEATTRHEQVKRLALDLETVDPYTFKSAATILVERGWRKETR